MVAFPPRSAPPQKKGKGWEPCVSKLSYFSHFAQPTFEHASHRGQRHDSQYSHAVVITRSHRTQLSPHALSAADSKACATLAQRRQGGSIHVECAGSSLTVARSGERRSTQTTSSRLLHRGHWCGIRRLHWSPVELVCQPEHDASPSSFFYASFFKTYYSFVSWPKKTEANASASVLAAVSALPALERGGAR